MKRIFTSVLATILVTTLMTSPLAGQNFTSRATIDQDFCGRSVIVVMQRGVDGMNLFSADPRPTTMMAATVETIIAVETITATSSDNFEMLYIRNLTYISQEAREASGPRGIPRMLKEETFKQVLLLQLPYNNKQNVLDVIEKLRFTPGIYSAKPNYFVRSTSVTPNDPQFHAQWGMRNIQAAEAWAITTGSHDVRVAFIDIGYQGHNDLNANFDFTHAWCFYSGQALTLGNLGNTTPNVGWHGNHVAGIVGAVGNNGIGVAGVAWEVSLVPFEVFVGWSGTDPVGSQANQIAALNRAIANDIPIVNMSMSGFSGLRSIVQSNFRGLFVWSAGNSASNVDATLPGGPMPSNALAVGAHDINNERANFSCYGVNIVQIWAPGTAILSTTLNNAHQNAQGTSMAAPQVAGVAALLLAESPNLTGVELKSLILEGALPITIEQPAANPGQHQSLRLNALGSLALLTAQVPYHEGFETTAVDAIPAGWVRYEDNQTTTWVVAGNTIDGLDGYQQPRSGDLQMVRTQEQAGNNGWIFSRPVHLHAGIAYTISFWYRAPGIDDQYDDFKVQIGASRDLTGTGANAQMVGATTVITHSNQQTPEWTQAYIDFIPTETGSHFIGFHCMTLAQQGFLIAIDDISITEAPVIRVELSQTETYVFPSQAAGYSARSQRIVTITNTGNRLTGRVNIALSGTHQNSFELTRTTIANIPIGGSSSFVVLTNIGLGVGTHAATVTVSGDNVTLVPVSFDVSFTVSDGTNIADVETAHAPSLQVFPNPVTDKLHIVIPSHIDTRDLVEIFDINGRRVFSQPICQLSIVNRQLTIDISHLPSGTYIVSIGQISTRIIKR